jgi:D-sedoheptulose 7-phosphate isomerase
MRPILTLIPNEVLRENVSQSLREGADLRMQLIEHCSAQIIRSAECIYDSVARGGKLLVFGNGGSAADAQHLAAEFVGRFTNDRAPLPAIALTTDTSALTAIGNDYGFDQVFARQVTALGNPPDVVIAISTSGRSKNILTAVTAASNKKLTTVAFTGGDGGPLAKMVDIPIIIPSASTPRIQECHLTLAHILCEVIEYLLANGKSTTVDDSLPAPSIPHQILAQNEASTRRWLRCVHES